MSFTGLKRYYNRRLWLLFCLVGFSAITLLGFDIFKNFEKLNIINSGLLIEYQVAAELFRMLSLEVVILILFSWGFFISLWISDRKIMGTQFVDVGNVLAANAEIRSKEIAFQVSHDLRSPLTALMAVNNGSSAFSPEVRELIFAASKRIREISDHLSRY